MAKTTSKKASTLSQDFLPAGLYFATLSRYYQSALGKHTEKLDIERHFSLLLLIGNTQDAISQKELAALLMVDKVTMVRMMDYLEESGYVRRKINPEDRREHSVILTAKGKKKLILVQKTVDKINQTLLKGIAAKGFYEMIDKMIANLSSISKSEVSLKNHTKRK